VCLGPELRFLNLSFSRSHDDGIVFERSDPPVASLKEWRRSGPGTVQLAAPHITSGSKFAFRVMFYPPLRHGEDVSVECVVTFPTYKLAFREDVVRAAAQYEGEAQNYELHSRTVDFPMDRLVLSVFLPDVLGASPLGLEVRRRRNAFPEEAQAIDLSGFYSVGRTERNGIAGTLLSLDRPNPPFKAQYRIRWLPRSDGESTAT
jgi:hypothetical protein